MNKGKKSETSITNKSKLLCDECDTMQKVKSVSFDSFGETVVLLRCFHTRGELLPLKEGRVSIEPYLVLCREDAPQREYSLRAVFNGLRYLVRTGRGNRQQHHNGRCGQ